MQGWLQWLIYVLAGIGTLVIICLIGTLIYLIISVIRDKIGDYKDSFLKYKDLYFKYKNNYLRYEDYYLKHKGYEDTSDREETLFYVRLDTGKLCALEIGYNFEKYSITNGELYDSFGNYIGKIEKIILRGKK